MEQLLGNKQIEELKKSGNEEESAESLQELVQLEDSENVVSDKQQRIYDVLNGLNKARRVRADKSKTLLAIKLLKSLVPAIPENMPVISGMSEGTVITEPPRPVAIRK